MTVIVCFLTLEFPKLRQKYTIKSNLTSQFIWKLILKNDRNSYETQYDKSVGIYSVEVTYTVR